MSTVSNAYQCSNCGDWHDYEESAIECCAPSAIAGWKCDACGDYHKLKANAENCCGFQCAECGQYSDEKSICEACDHDMTMDRATPAQLEAAGQQRLAL